MLLPSVDSLGSLKGHVQQGNQTRTPVMGHQHASGNYHVILKVFITFVSS